MVQKDLILTFLRSHTLAVISTINGHKPESAVIKIAVADNFELIFNTFSTYRKYKNIASNPNVCVVIGWDNNITVQYEGRAVELQTEEYQRYKRLYLQQHPTATKWDAFAQTRYFKIIPVWLRYSDVRDFEKRIVVELDEF